MLSITGVEVIRANHEPPPGSLALQALPGEKLELTYGDSLRIATSFKYRAGADIDVTLWGAIGNRGLIRFDPIVIGEATVRLTKSLESTPATATVHVPVTADISPGANYDIQCKIKEYPEAGAEVKDVITITGIQPTFELLEETIYPYAYIYDGLCDVTTFTFMTDPFTPASWVAGRLAKHFENEARKSGLRVMEMKVYVDKSPLFWTNWRIEVVGTPAPITGIASAPVIPPWAAILIIAFAIIAVIIVATLATKTIVGLFKRKPGLEDVKVGWKKNDLIAVIQSSEEYWERTPTPIGTLEAMSEEDLRHLLNKIAEQEVPPPAPIPPLELLLLLGIGVLGVGGVAMAAAMARPGEK